MICSERLNLSLSCTTGAWGGDHSPVTRTHCVQHVSPTIAPESLSSPIARAGASHETVWGLLPSTGPITCPCMPLYKRLIRADRYPRKVAPACSDPSPPYLSVSMASSGSQHHASCPRSKVALKYGQPGSAPVCFTRKRTTWLLPWRPCLGTQSCPTSGSAHRHSIPVNCLITRLSLGPHLRRLGSWASTSMV